jgi:CHAD domain-containing protein
MKAGSVQAPGPIGRRLRPAGRGLSAGQSGLHRHLRTSLKEQWKRYRRRLRRCRKECSEEAVHDLRVEIRRMLSSVELTGAFASRRHREKNERLLKKHLESFGELRDTQVQLLRLGSFVPGYAAARLFQEALRRQEAGLLRLAGRRVRRFRPARLRRALERVRREIKTRRAGGLERRDGMVIRRALNRAFSRVVRLQQKVHPQRRDTIHRTRVAFKKFRYMVEALAPLLPRVSAERLQAMHDHQNLMGDIQDLEVLRLGFEAFEGEENLAAEDACAFRRELERRSESAVRACLSRAGRLAEFKPL